jgi:hypothetical protein
MLFFPLALWIQYPFNPSTHWTRTCVGSFPGIEPRPSSPLTVAIPSVLTYITLKLNFWTYSIPAMITCYVLQTLGRNLFLQPKNLIRFHAWEEQRVGGIGWRNDTLHYLLDSIFKPTTHKSGNLKVGVLCHMVWTSLTINNKCKRPYCYPTRHWVKLNDTLTLHLTIYHASQHYLSPIPDMFKWLTQ